MSIGEMGCVKCRKKWFPEVNADGSVSTAHDCIVTPTDIEDRELNLRKEMASILGYSPYNPDSKYVELQPDEELDRLEVLFEAWKNEQVRKAEVGARIDELDWVKEFAQFNMKQKSIRYPDLIRGVVITGTELDNNIRDRIKQLRTPTNSKGLK